MVVHLLLQECSMGKYFCTADPLFDWFGLYQTSKAVANSTQSKQNKQKVSHTIILPLKSVLLGLAIEQTQTSKAVANST